MDLGTYKSVDAEIWFRDRFCYAGIFEILIFRDFSGGQLQIFAILTKMFDISQIVL